jgi:hypothetical protein
LPKLARHWKYKRQSADEIWLVEIITSTFIKNKKQTIVGHLQEVSQENEVDGQLKPCALNIYPHLGDFRVRFFFDISDFEAIRLLYTPEIQEKHDKDRFSVIAKALDPHLLQDLISLVSGYLAGDPPSGLPQVCYDFLDAHRQ